VVQQTAVNVYHTRFHPMQSSKLGIHLQTWGARILSCTALGYGLDDQRFKSWQGLGIFLFTTESRPALGPTQPPIQWVPEDLFLGVKQPGCEADHSPPSSAEAKNA